MRTLLYLKNAGGGSVPDRHVFQCSVSNKIIDFSEITHVELHGTYHAVSLKRDDGSGDLSVLEQEYIRDIWLHRGHQVEATQSTGIIILHL